MLMVKEGSKFLLSKEIFEQLLAKNNNEIDDLLSKSTSMGVMDNDQNVCDNALNLFEALFKKGKGYAAAITAASAGITA